MLIKLNGIIKPRPHPSNIAYNIGYGIRDKIGNVTDSFWCTLHDECNKYVMEIIFPYLI